MLQNLVTLMFAALTIAGIGLASYTDFWVVKGYDTQHLNRSNNPNIDSNSNNLDEIQINSLKGLFGIASRETEKEQSAQNLPETRLELTLKGTFTHEEKDKASALIARKNGSTTRYFVGDKVEDAELLAVDNGFVTLRRNGKKEKLQLPIMVGERISSGAPNPRIVEPTVLQQQPTPDDMSIAEQRRLNLQKRLSKLKNASQED